MTTKLDRVLRRNKVTTASLVRATKGADPKGRGYSRTYVYGIRRGEIENPTRKCMAVILAAVRQLVGQQSLEVGDLFEFSAKDQRRKAS